MKKLFFAFALTSTLISCNKETTTPNNSGNTTTDTTKTINDVSISGFDCEGVKIAGTLTKDKVASNVTATLTYTGGNGKTYLTKSYTSTGVTGLSATMLAGTLANGEGTLVYNISGTPTSFGTANFTVAFGGVSCVISVTVEGAAQTIGIPGPNITDVENNTYNTVYIGTQQWMGENLKVSKYSDGTTIPNITDNRQWASNTTGAWCYYDNNAANNVKYGKLYNWYAVSKTTNGNKNVCPTGWHVPTDAEWTVLTDYLGGESVAGGKMKDVGTTSWNSSSTEVTNVSLFTGLPGGYRSSGGPFPEIGSGGYWWSSKLHFMEGAWKIYLGDNFSGVTIGSSPKESGFSVRCLRD
jgi:uncharacterized protein (TIGR02145 family)